MTTHLIETQSSPLTGTFETFFATKTACDLEGTMSYFSPNLACYIDATLGWDLNGYDALKGVFRAVHAELVAPRPLVRHPRTFE